MLDRKYDSYNYEEADGMVTINAQFAKFGSVIPEKKETSGSTDNPIGSTLHTMYDEEGVPTPSLNCPYGIILPHGENGSTEVDGDEEATDVVEDDEEG